MFAFVAGGAASGKSAWAEAAAMALGGRKIYIATMEPFGEEASARIQKHRAARQEKGFQTVEIYTGMDRRARAICGDTVLLECMTNWMANEMYSPSGVGKKALEAVENGMAALQAAVPNLVVVSGDLFCEGLDYGPYTGEYLENLANINRKLAVQADLVAELCCGIPIIHRQTEAGRIWLEKMV
ncbi:MAG: bifunctional adenosylcobinamide kinase/adenosylcobinamide-phosphate guanylyltransferase [Oscillospiraceae bacterium]|nr:bifunctional adenosylcobinamide kinase/adenosylcobinamide-phosphate guanylyltransferase [Oscillospiraceae bacterium]